MNRFLMTPLLTAVTNIGVDDFNSVLTAITGQISVSTVVAVLAAGAGACIGLVFMWWGARKLISIVMGAFRKGKVSV